MEKNFFELLNKINVSDKTEKKNGLTYLSWAWAWGEVKKIDPAASYTIYENADGMFYHTDGKTCWVKTGVTVGGQEYVEYLPVMDYNNHSITLDKVTSFDVNKAIQRSLTKACARHGLGLYIYAGEDLPEQEQTKAAKPAGDGLTVEQRYQRDKAQAFAWFSDHILEATSVLEKYNVGELSDLTREQWGAIIAGMKQRQLIAA